MYLEHANVTVPSIEANVRFLSTALPEFRELGGGPLFGNAKLGRWIHFGTDDPYIALTELKDPAGLSDGDYQTAGVKHLGFVVDDVHAVIERCRAAGYEPTDASAMGSHPFQKRVYFVNGCGPGWEFVEYLSDKKSEQHDYKLR